MIIIGGNPEDNKKREELVDAIHDFYISNGRVPLSHEFGKNGLPSAGIYKEYFGTVKSAIDAAGYSREQKRARRQKALPSREELIEELLVLTEKRGGYLPGGSDIDADKLTHNLSVFKAVFGSLEEALRATGLIPEEMQGSLYHIRYELWISRNFPKDDVIRILKERAEVLGRVPRQNEFNLPPVFFSAIEFYFEGYRKALAAAGLIK